MSEAGQMQLVVVRNPFDRHSRDERSLPACEAQTIERLVADHLPLSPAIRISVNGEMVPRDEWAARTIIEGDCVVVMPEIHGDDQTFKTVLMVALVVAANTYSGGLASAMGIGGAFGTGMVAVGITMAGSALINALIPTPQPTLGSIGASASTTATSAYSWNPATTQQPGGVVARAYGLNKLYGNIISGYIKTSGSTGQEQHAHMLIDLGTGPYNRLYDFKLNDQPVGNYSGVNVTARMGYLDQSPIPAFNDTLTTHPIGAKIVNGTPVVRDTVGSDYDALEINLLCPNGLWYSNDSGGLNEVTVYVSVEISADNGATWSHIAQEPRTIVTVAPGYWSRGRWVKKGFGRSAYSVWVESAKGGSDRASHTEGELDPAGYGQRWRWMDTPTNIYTTVVDSITLSGATQQPVRRQLRVDNLARGTRYKVRCINISADQTTSRWGDDVYLAEISEVMYDDFQYPRTVLVGVDALATSQISGSIKFSCMAEGAIVAVYNGSSWSRQYSNNPAWVCWDILTQPVLDNNLVVVRYDGLDPSRLDAAAFKAWADFCDEMVPDGKGGYEKRCTFDGVSDFSTNVWDAALEVCASARAQLTRRGTTISVIYDDVRPLPAQLFSVANTAVSSFRETFLPMQDRAASIEVSYVDASNDYVRDNITVVNTNITESAAQRVQIALRGVTRASQAWREANYRLKRNELLHRSASISVDIDALACTVGDLIWLQDDTTRWGIGGRAVAGSTTTKLYLDQSVTLDSGKTYELKLRLADDTLLTRTITTAAGTVSAVDVSVAFPSAPSLYDVWAIGETGKAVKEFLVVDISRDGDQRAKLSLLEYNASLYGLDDGIPAIATANVSGGAGQDLPSINNVRTIEVMELSAAGSVAVHLDIYFDILGSKTKKADIYESGRFIGTSNSGVFRANNVASGKEYSFEIRPFNYIGLSPSGSWKYISHVVVGLLRDPQDISGFSVEPGSSSDTLTWAKCPDIDVQNGGAILVRHSPWKTGATWESSTSVCYPLPGKSTTVSVPGREGTYFVKAEDSGGRQSKIAARYVSDGATAFTYTPPSSNLTEIDEYPAFSGTHQGTYRDDGAIGAHLELIGASLIDSILDFDSISKIDYEGGVISSGIYSFENQIDLGSVKSSRLTSTLSALAENVLNNLDDRTQTVDSWVDFDGTSGAPVDAWIECRKTNDDPSLSPTWSEWQRLASANFTSRAFQFRALLFSSDPAFNIFINQLKVKVEAI